MYLAGARLSFSYADDDTATEMVFSKKNDNDDVRFVFKTGFGFLSASRFIPSNFVSHVNSQNCSGKEG